MDLGSSTTRAFIPITQGTAHPVGFCHTDLRQSDTAFRDQSAAIALADSR